MSDVYLYVYDLSLGLAKKFTDNIDGIWHTSIVAFDEENWFALNGLNRCNPKKYLSKTHDQIYLGQTEITKQEFIELVDKIIEKGSYVFGDYNLLTHNCNCFSNDLSLSLFNKPNPDYIMQLPKNAMFELMNKPFVGKVFKPLYKRAAKPIENNVIPLNAHKLGDSIVNIFQGKNSNSYGNNFLDIVKEHLDKNNIKWYIEDVEEIETFENF
jgi:hypothetical protein